MWSKYLESEGWEREEFNQTLEEVLEAEEFERAEFICDIDLAYTFLWLDLKLSDEAKEEFKDILALPIAIRHVKSWVGFDCPLYEHDNIIFWYGGSPEEERKIEKQLRRFLLATAGYVSEELYEKWFIEKQKEKIVTIDNYVLDGFKEYLESVFHYEEPAEIEDTNKLDLKEIAQDFFDEWLEQEVSEAELEEFAGNFKASVIFKETIKKILESKGLVELKTVEEDDDFYPYWIGTGIFMKPEDIDQKINDAADWDEEIVRGVSAYEGLETLLRHFHIPRHFEENDIIVL